MEHSLPVSFLSRAAEAIAETYKGLTGPQILLYCNAFAVDHDVDIPHAAYPFQTSNKRTALIENLRAFPAHLQYSLLMELCDDSRLAENEPVQKFQALLQQRYSHLGNPISSNVGNAAVLAPHSIDYSPHGMPTVTFIPEPPEIPYRPYDIFLSYSHTDEPLMSLVREHLVLYDRMSKIRKWWDRKLLGGSTVKSKITNHLASSDIILLFVSSSFLASDYCYDIEMRQALDQHAAGRSVVVPVILRPCGWMESPFGHLLALPTDGKPLTTWSNQDEAAKSVADGVMRIVANLQRRQE